MILARCEQQAVRRGFTLVESLVSITVMAIAGGAMLAAMGAAVVGSTNAAQTNLARGLAEQMMNEISSRRFPDSSDNRPPSGSPRMDFDDMDDFNGWSAAPPQHPVGVPLGYEGQVTWSDGSYFGYRPLELRPDLEYLRQFRREVLVESVEPNGSGGWRQVAGANFRRVTVRVTFTDENTDQQPLAELSRIFSNVPQ